MRCVELLNLHVEVELGLDREPADVDLISAGNVGPAHLGRDLYQPLGAAFVERIVQQTAILILIGLSRNHAVAVIHAGQGHRIVFAEGDAANEAGCLGRVPARGCASQQRLCSGGLNRGVAVGNFEFVAAAVFGDRLFNDTLPTGQIVSLQLFEDAALGTFRPTISPPLQPLGAKCVNAEVKETGERDTHDRIQLTGPLIAGLFEFMVQQGRDGQTCSPERFIQAFVVGRIKHVQVNFRKVAVEVRANDFATGVESVAIHAVIQLLLA